MSSYLNQCLLSFNVINFSFEVQYSVSRIRILSSVAYSNYSLFFRFRLYLFDLPGIISLDFSDPSSDLRLVRNPYRLNDTFLIHLLSVSFTKTLAWTKSHFLCWNLPFLLYEVLLRNSRNWTKITLLWVCHWADELLQ